VSIRDPIEELAEIFLYNLEDWWAEVRVMEPQASRSFITLPAVRGAAGNIVESFVLRRDTALRSLRVVRGVVRRLPRHLKEIYRLRYREGLTRDEISEKAHCHVRTVDKRLAIIRGRVAGRLSRLVGDDKADLMGALGPILGPKSATWRNP